MEILAVVAVVLIERARFDLMLRRWWSRLPLPRPALAVRVPVPVALAGLDLRRAAVRLSTLGLAYVMWRVYWPAETTSVSPYDTVGVLTGRPFLFIGVVLIAVLAIVGGRDRDNELVAALPAASRRHILGWTCTVAVAALVSYAIVLLSPLRLDGSFAALPGAWDVAQVPAAILGAGMLGLVAARYLPGWVAAPLAVIAAVAWVVVLSKDSWGLQMLTVVPEWVEYHEDGRVVFVAGSFAWHNAFLLGLCGLGLVAALLRDAERRRGLLVSGTVVLAGTVAAAALALP